MITNFEMAFSFASRGVPVFPCRPEGKRPIPSNGYRSATTTERIIRIWWERHPDALVGMPTGERTGVWVLDVDVKSGGLETLAALEAEHGRLPATRTVRTSSGGKHYYWQHCGLRCSAGRLHRRGIDVRGDGGLVIVPGSALPDGRRYELIDDSPPTDSPEWLLSLVRPRPYVPRPSAPYEPGTADHYVNAAVRSELARLAESREGNRGTQLNNSAYALGTLVGAGALSRSDAEAGLWSAAVTCGVAAKDGERATWSTIRRGLSDGSQKPRSIPKDSTRLIDVSGMITLARRSAA